MGYYMAGGYYQAGGFLGKLSKFVGKVAPAVTLINPALGSALYAGAKVAGALDSRSGGTSTGGIVPPAPAFPGIGYAGRARRTRRARRRRY